MSDTLTLCRCYQSFYLESYPGAEDGPYCGSDWDYPGFAQSLGWNIRESSTPKDKHGRFQKKCSHMGTDGTVDCPDCGKSATAFISEASDFLFEHEDYEFSAENLEY